MKSKSFYVFLVCLAGCGTETPEPPSLQQDVQSDATDTAAPPADGVAVDPDAVDAAGTADGTVAVQPAAVDVLWVIDHSPSMCREQVDLAKNFKFFLDELSSEGPIDAQMAVVTVQQIADVGTSPMVRKVGGFMASAAASFPPNCIERVTMPCTLDAQCTKTYEYTYSSATVASMCPAAGKAEFSNPYGGTDWRCKATSDPKSTTNDNCSINSYCWKHCKTDDECRAVFEPDVPKAAQRIQCYVPGGTSFEIASCQFPPPTEGCPPPDRMACSDGYPCSNGLTCVDGACRAAPCTSDVECKSGLQCLDDECRKPCTSKDACTDGFVCSRGYCTGLPTVLKHDQLDLFRCIATIGAAQTQESKFEGGLRSAWYALDPNGPNCPKSPNGNPLPGCQYQQLVRDKALLVIVFVSDDDDCSVQLSISLGNGTKQDKEDLDKVMPQEVRERCQDYGDAVAGNVWLNEGHCEFLKYKDPKITCPSDCLKLAAGSPERAACDVVADASVAASKKADPRFAPVAEFAKLFKTLKADPDRVVVAAITGDTVVAGGPNADVQIHTDRALYYESKLRNVGAGQAPYICKSKLGDAGFGSRYVQLTAAFGKGGYFGNICEPAGLGPTLEALGQHVRQRLIAGK